MSNGMGGGIDIADSSNGVGEEAEVNIYIRIWSRPTFSIQVNLNSTVEDLKSVVAENCEIPAEQQRLIYKGRVMKGVQTLKSFGLKDNRTVHLVRIRATATTDAGIRNANSTSTNDGSNKYTMELVQDPNTIRDILDNPETTLHNFYMNNPRISQMLNQNPDLRHMLDEALDPATRRETAGAILNVLRVMSNLESSLEPLLNATTLPGDNRSDFGSNPSAALLGAQAGRTGTENTTNFPGNKIIAGEAGNMGLDMLNSASRPQVLPEERYATELSQLREMGFFDAQENIRALIATAGNVRAAVQRLLGNPSQ